MVTKPMGFRTGGMGYGLLVKLFQIGGSKKLWDTGGYGLSQALSDTVIGSQVSVSGKEPDATEADGYVFQR